MRIPGDSLESAASPSGGVAGIRSESPARFSVVELRALAALLALPDSDGLEALEWMVEATPWLAPSVEELKELPLDRWQAEHTRLFINGFPKTPCPPFESAYRHGQMGGMAVDELETLYSRSGLDPGDIPADYLGVMLEYAAHLEGREAEAELREALWKEHFARWLPRFANDLRTHARLRLYRDLADRLATYFPESG